MGILYYQGLILFLLCPPPPPLEWPPLLVFKDDVNQERMSLQNQEKTAACVIMQNDVFLKIKNVIFTMTQAKIICQGTIDFWNPQSPRSHGVGH